MCSVIPFDRLRTDLWLAPQGMKRGQVVILSVANGSAFSDIRRVKRRDSSLCSELYVFSHSLTE